MIKDKKQICFLIGAGAEGRGQLNLPNGQKFKKDVILAKNTKNIYEKINNSEKHSFNNRKLIHHNSHNILYQTLKEHRNEFSFDNDKWIIIDNYFKYKEEENKDNKLVVDEFKCIYTDEFYKKLDIEEEKFTKNLKSFLENASFYSYIDSYFNYLRHPDDYKSECTKVMKLYFSALNSILNSIGNYEELLRNKEKDILKNREKLYNYIVDSQKKIINQNINNQNLYYNQIKTIKNDKLEINVVSTNYTNFAKELIALDDDHIAMVHGELELFENLKTKEVKKITEFKENDIIFPYIMVQSGVKPIFSPVQIKQMSKAYDFIVDSDIFLVLGFNVNPDDEHITSFLRDRLNKNKTIKFIVYDDGEDSYKKYVENIKNIFKDNLAYCEFDKTTNFMNILDEIK